MAVNELSLPLQMQYLKKYYANCINFSDIKRNTLICIMTLRPSLESCAYKIKIEGRQSRRPKIWLMSPPLKKIEGKLPHHLYPTKGKYPELCVYDSRKGYNELHGNDLWAYTLIPWILSWLNTYEYWVITGEWHHAEVLQGKQVD